MLLIRRVKLDPGQVSADPRSRRRRTLHPDQRAMLFPELEQEPAIYAYSFICTNLDVSTPAKAAAAETGTGTAPARLRDSKHGDRVAPPATPATKVKWMWAALPRRPWLRSPGDPRRPC